MTTRGTCEPTSVFTVPRDECTVNEGEYLSDTSPRHKPWDVHRSEADEVSSIFANSQFSRHQRYAKRVDFCAQVLEFARDPPTDLFQSQRKLKLTNAWFCRV
jgi:hypothetical protein